MRVFGPRPDAAERADINDPPSARFPHQPGALLAAEEHCLQVDGMDEVPVLLGYVERIETGEAARAVDQAVQASEALLDFSEHALNFGHVLEVGAKQSSATGLGGGTLSVRF